MTPRELVVYGDVDLNLIDGSAIWVQSTVQVLASVPDCHIRVMLKAPIHETRLIEPMEVLDNVEVVKPFEDSLYPDLRNSLSPHQVAVLLDQLDHDRRVDAFVVRGLRVARHLAGDGRFDGRMWTYLTDIPQSVSDASPADLDDLATVVESSKVLLCQTEDLRSHIEQLIPAAIGRTFVTPPVVHRPADAPDAAESPGSGPVRLVYTGKMAKAWRTEEMTSLPAALGSLGIDAELHVVGDKIHNEPDDAEFQDRMRAALDTAGVVWHGGVPRAEAMRIASDCHIGLSWRTSKLDDSLELSTKVLEFGAMGRPVVLNRTPPHEDLLGTDYPLFVSDQDSVVQAIAAVLRDPGLFLLAAERCRSASDRYTLPSAVERMTGIVSRLLAAPSVATPRLKVLVASHDLKFMHRLLDELSLAGDLEIRLDNWSALAVHDEATSRELNDWADVVVCEWCGPNAIWYSKHKRPGQRLLVRLHRFELASNYPDALVADAIDTLVTVDPHYRDLTRARIPAIPSEKVINIPNWVDVAAFDRPKLAGARFNLGMIGIAPRRKRFDLALDVLAAVRREDERFGLFVKSKMPWEYWWIWKDDAEKEHYRAALRRVQTDPDLEGAVAFDGFGPDVAAWLRKIGCVLSTSDDESFHLSPAESMASGGTAVVFPWPGADTVYESEWLVADVEAAAASVLAQADPQVWNDRRALARRQIGRYDLPAVTAAWHDLIRGTETRA
jgi:glycosyltransferase involved in cell wall biosynthesis